MVVMLYVAYGSNMNLEQMKFRCPNSRVVSNGILKGWKLIFNVHADIIQTENENDFVPVVVWDIAEEDWRRLDMYEGFPSYYVKQIVNVILDNGENESAVVYVMDYNKKGVYPPSEDYFGGIYWGYIDNGIDVECLYKALKHSYQNNNKNNKNKAKEMM